MTTKKRSHGIAECSDPVMVIVRHDSLDRVIAKSPLCKLEGGLPESRYANLVVRVHAAGTEVVFKTAARR